MDDAKSGLLARARSKRAKAKEADIGKRQGAGSSEMSYNTIPRPATSGEYNSLRSDEIIIGLALGSPHESPLPPVAHNDRENLDDCPFPLSEKTAMMMNKASQAASDDKAPRSKNAKWKPFGGLFAKKDNQTKLSQSDQEAHQAETNDTSPQHAKSIRNRAVSDREKRAQPSGTARSLHDEESPSVLRRSSTKRKMLRKRKIEELKNERQRAHTFPPSGVSETRPQFALNNRLQKQNDSDLPLPKPSLLQVDIPNVSMERYSVMFGDVLSSRPQTSVQVPLLARRQANLDELAPKPLSIRKDSSPAQPASISTEVQKAYDIAKLARKDHSASSSVSKSPSFSLFPTIPAAINRGATAKPVPKPSPLSRSLTAPNNTGLSPPRPTLKASKSEDMNELVILVESCQDLLPSKAPMTEVRKQSITSTCSDQPPQPSFVEHPESCSENETSVTGSGKDVFIQHKFPARKSSMKDTIAIRPPEPQFDLFRASNDSVHSLSAAEVSIARQISFSHRQRQLLVPIMSKNVKQPQLIDTHDILATRNSHHLNLEQV